VCVEVEEALLLALKAPDEGGQQHMLEDVGEVACVVMVAVVHG
jgi:hypothetical protein